MSISIRAVLALGAVTIGAASAPAAAQDPGEWQYREDAESCRAYRTIGNGELLQLRSFGPGSAVEATVASARLPDEPASVRQVELGWDGKGLERPQLGLMGAVGQTPTVTMLTAHRPVKAFFFYDQGAILTSRLDPAVETMQLRVVGYAPLELRVGSLEQPLRRLGECEAALMAKWGWSPDPARRVAREPEFIDPQQMFYKVIVYPAVQNLNRVSSILQLRMRIDASGKVAECVAQSSPGSNLFGSKNCENLRRFARFRPALDAQDRPVDGYLQMSITFARYD